jgi:phosphoribosylformimino-5-aminoimidazole carboxamide ribotide isomerase
MVESVDIPIELGGDLRGIEAVRQALDLGVYRVVVGSMVTEDPDQAKRLIDVFGPSKIVLGIDAIDGIVVARGQDSPSGLSALSVGLNARMLGFRRMLYTEVRKDETLRGVNLTILRKLGENTGMRITAAGGIGGLEDLLRIQELERCGVDSVIVGRALYENRFSCQVIWRMCEAGNYPYTAKV